jgi:hypothetical protein
MIGGRLVSILIMAALMVGAMGTVRAAPSPPTMVAMRSDLRSRIQECGSPVDAPDYSDRTINGVKYASAVADIDTDKGLTPAIRMAETYRANKRLIVYGETLDQDTNQPASQDELDLKHVFASIHLL